MTLGQRIDERRRALGISQAELARRVGMRQSTLNSLIKGDSRSSRRIVQLARELNTSPSFLLGEIDDSDSGAPPPTAVPTHHFLLLPVAFPSEAALTRVFEGLLRPFELEREELLARTLARQLPKVLQRLPPQLIEGREADREFEVAEAQPSGHSAPAPERST